MTIPNEIRDLIHKLKAMTTSPNINEAAVAASKLQSLLLRHNLSEADIPDRSHRYDAYRNEIGRSGCDWRRRLINAIAATNGCYAFYNAKDATVIVIGEKGSFRFDEDLHEVRSVRTELHAVDQVRRKLGGSLRLTLERDLHGGFTSFRHRLRRGRGGIGAARLCENCETRNCDQVDSI